MDENEKKDNKYLLEKQLETLKLFYERKLLTKEQYEFKIDVLKEKIKIEKKIIQTLLAGAILCARYFCATKTPR